MSIPVEILTMGASALLGGVLKIWGMSMESKKLQHQMMMEKFTASEDSRQAAREGPKEGKRGFQWTRRVIALSVVFSVIVLPKLVVFMTFGPDVAYGWSEVQEESWFGLIGGNTIQHWSIIPNAILITPLDTHIVSAIIGLYFGASVTGSKS